MNDLERQAEDPAEAHTARADQEMSPAPDFPAESASADAADPDAGDDPLETILHVQPEVSVALLERESPPAQSEPTPSLSAPPSPFSSPIPAPTSPDTTRVSLVWLALHHASDRRQNELVELDSLRVTPGTASMAQIDELELSGEPDSWYNLLIPARDGQEGPLVQARLRYPDPEVFPPPTGVRLEDLRARCPEAVSAREFLKGVGAPELLPGELRLGMNELLACLPPVDGSLREPSHAAALELVLGLARALQRRSGHDTGTLVLRRVSRGLLSPLHLACQYVWVRLEHQPGAGQGFAFSCQLLAADGRLLLQLERARLEPGRAARPGELDIAGWQYIWSREETPTVDRGSITQELEASQDRRQWILLADDTGVASALSGRLERNGHPCVLVQPGVPPVGRETRHLWLDALQPVPVEQFVKERCRDGRVRAIVHFWGLGLDTEVMRPEALEAAVRRSLMSTVHLLTALDKLEPADRPLFFVMTWGAQSVGVERVPVSVAQACLWGMLPSAGGIQPCWVDLCPIPFEGEIEALARLLLHARPGDCLALRPEGPWRREHVSAGLAPLRGEQLVQAAGRSYQLEPAFTGSGIRAREADRVPPGSGEVEIAVEVLPLAALETGRGSAPGQPRWLSFLGRVEAVGDWVDEYRAGDAVVGFAPIVPGSHATVSVSQVARRPSGLSAPAALNLPTAYATAWYAMQEGARLSAGERVLIAGAASGAGLVMAALAARAGAEVLLAERGPVRMAALEAHSPSRIFDLDDAGVLEQVLEATDGRGVELLITCCDLSPSVITGLVAQDGSWIDLNPERLEVGTPLPASLLRRRVRYTFLDLPGLARDRGTRFSSLLHQVSDQAARSLLPELPGALHPVTTVRRRAHHSAASLLSSVCFSLQDPNLRVGVPLKSGRCNPNGLYLVVVERELGWLGCVRWLMGQGARRILVLHTGTGLPANTPATPDSLGPEGALLWRWTGEVDEQLEARIGGIQAQAGLPRGILVVGTRQGIGNRSEEVLAGLEQALLPRLLCIWSLHLLTRRRSLDFFVPVLLGSASAAGGRAAEVLESAGEALCLHRRSLGLPANGLFLSTALAPSRTVSTTSVSSEDGLFRSLVEPAGSAGESMLEQLLSRLLEQDLPVFRAAELPR